VVCKSFDTNITRLLGRWIKRSFVWKLK
jgi:hypothetical protein